MLLDAAPNLRQSVRVAVHPATGIGVPTLGASKRRSSEARRFFHARVSSGRCASGLFMAGGAREPQGSPVQGRYANRASSATLRMASQAADSTTSLESTP